MPGVVDHDDAVLAVALRLGERLGDVGRQQLGQRRPRGQRPAQQRRGRGVGDGELAVGGHADHALGEVVEQDLDVLLFALDLREGLAQAAAHHVEGHGELADLVGRAGAHRAREVARGDRQRAALDALEAPGDEVRGEIAGEQGGDEGEAAGQQDLVLDRTHRALQVGERRRYQDDAAKARRRC